MIGTTTTFPALATSGEEELGPCVGEAVYPNARGFAPPVIQASDPLLLQAAVSGDLASTRDLVGAADQEAIVTAAGVWTARGCLEGLEVLLPSVDLSVEYVGYSLLSSAAIAGDVSLVELLLDAGVAPDSLGWEGETALGGASSVEIARLLLERGASVSATSDLGATPLDSAVANRRAPEILRLLLEYGATITVNTLSWATGEGDGSVGLLLLDLMTDADVAEIRAGLPDEHYLSTMAYESRQTTLGDELRDLGL